MPQLNSMIRPTYPGGLPPGVQPYMGAGNGARIAPVSANYALPQNAAYANGGAYAGAIQQRHAELTLGSSATPFGCCTYFDQCDDNVLTASFGGRMGLLDALNFREAEDCYRTVQYMTYVRPQFEGDTPTVGYVADACARPNGVEFGGTKITVEDFGLYGRSSKPRKILKPERRCRTWPRYRLNGTPIANELEWDMVFVFSQMLNDIRNALVTGDATVEGQFDGFERWITASYANEMMRSYVMDWNGNPMSGGAGITYNGNLISGSFQFMDILLDVNTQINQRISWAPALESQTLNLGQKFLLMPYNAIRCLLDHYTCWYLCPDADPNTSAVRQVVNTFEGRAFRDDLNGGLFGFGSISLDGEIIPIMPYDFSLIKGPKTFDMYLLTTGVGSVPLFEGEYLNADTSLEMFLGGDGANDGFFSTDGGRILGQKVTDNLCRIVSLWQAIRLFCMAPWAQARFASIQCTRPLGFLSQDPLATSYFPQKTFISADCPV